MAYCVRRTGGLCHRAWCDRVDVELARGVAECVEMVRIVPVNAVYRSLGKRCSVVGDWVATIEVKYLQPSRSESGSATAAARVAKRAGDRQQLPRGGHVHDGGVHLGAGHVPVGVGSRKVPR